MLELKAYQTRTLNELNDFLSDVNKLVHGSKLEPEKALKLTFSLKNEDKPYKSIPEIPNVPYLCIKIPTGGGKTLVASHSLSTIFDNYLLNNNGKGLVMWFVPSDAIRTQTLSSLLNRKHPYREIIESKFGNRVKVFTLEEALSIKKSDLQNNLSIVITSLQSFRRADKNWLKVFKNNGSLISHFGDLVEDTSFLDKDEGGEVIYSLGNVIKMNSPLVILDEGHNVQTNLSYDMLRDINPSFILEYTATPRSESNVLVDIESSELKAENMVKIPIILDNLTQWQETIREGVTQLKKLDKLTNKEKRDSKEYIRPIALLQAEQEKEDEDKIYVEKIKRFLITELKIREEEIAIKTAKNDEIKNINLLSSKCKIKYIITVNALKEGWDCPFAYVLISVSNIGSRIAVEQTIGRILRLPNTKQKKSQDLNQSFVFTSSESFSKASSAVISGLKANGYSRADLRGKNEKEVVEKKDFERFISDPNISVPYIAIKDKDSQLSFSRDLVGENFQIYEHYKPFEIGFHDDQNRQVKIDIDKEKGIYRIIQDRLVVIIHKEDLSIEELSKWLKINLRHTLISATEMNKYVDLAIKDLENNHTIEELSLNRFRLKEKLLVEVSNIISEFAKKHFETLVNQEKIASDSILYSPSDTIRLARLSSEHFQKHLFERCGYMNGEETEFAMRLDGLENIKWWYRNREKEDFYLQGWRPNKFYPDFILKTKDGSYVLVEYKGEDRLSNEDTLYKQELGNFWQKLCKERNKFFLVGKASIDQVLRQISQIQ